MHSLVVARSKRPTSGFNAMEAREKQKLSFSRATCIMVPKKCSWRKNNADQMIIQYKRIYTRPNTAGNCNFCWFQQFWAKLMIYMKIRALIKKIFLKKKLKDFTLI